MITAKQQMQWQERLANTAHVREVADLQAAGLNPVLSAGGSGAATPSGSIDSYSSGVSSGKGYSRKSSKDPNSVSAIIKETGDQVSKAVEKVFDSLPSSAKQNNNMSSENADDGYFARLGRSIEEKNTDATNMMAKALSVFGVDKSFLNRSVPFVGKYGIKWRDVFGGYFKRAAEIKQMYKLLTDPNSVNHRDKYWSDSVGTPYSY